MTPRLDSHLTLSPEQQGAVDCDARAILVVASAGTGKTEVVARRVERLLSADGFFRILAVSYTEKSARELEQRIASRLGDLARRVDAKTIHGFALDLLRQHGTHLGLPIDPEILSRDEDRVALFSRWFEGQGRPVPDQIDKALNRIDLARAGLQAAPLIEDWWEALDSSGALDYPAMLTRATELVRLPWMHRQLKRFYGHVIVDEAQNLTAAQYELLVAMIGPPENDGQHAPAMFVGDAKQSIVGFAGADARFMHKFADDYGARKFEFQTNFRSAQSIAILGAAVAKDLNRLVGVSGSGSGQAPYAAPGRVCYRELDDEEDEAAFVTRWTLELLENGMPIDALTYGEMRSIKSEDIAVLARWNATLNTTERALRGAGLEVAKGVAAIDWMYTDLGRIVTELISVASSPGHQAARWRLGELLHAGEELVGDLVSVGQELESHQDASVRTLAGLCEAKSPEGFMARIASIDIPQGSGTDCRSFWSDDFSLLQDDWDSFARSRPRMERTWPNFRDHIFHQRRGNDSDPGVRLLTIHKAQNREYRAVALVGANDGQLPDFRASNAEEHANELRAFYVAVTRASRVLLVTRSRRRRTSYGSMMDTEPSRFIEYLRGVGIVDRCGS